MDILAANIYVIPAARTLCCLSHRSSHRENEPIASQLGQQMPIEFQCAACQTAIRTPDGTQGKPARCPQCGAVVTVPQTEDVVRAEAAAYQPTAAPRSANPYAPPANIFAADPFQPVSPAVTAERVRSRLLAPAIGMIVFALTGLLFMALVAVGMVADPNRVFG